MDYRMQARAYEYIETLLNNGHGFNTLPITMERAQGIITLREQPTKDEMKALRVAVVSNPVVEN